MTPTKDQSGDDFEIVVQTRRNVDGVTPQHNQEGFARLTRAQLEDAARRAREVGAALLGPLTRVENPPSKVALEFGITAGAEGGVPFVTKGTIEAQFKITVEWERK